MKKVTIKTTYKDYVAQSTNPVSYAKYSDINYKFMQFIISIVFLGDRVYLPERMGSLVVKGKKQKLRIVGGHIKGLAPDWKATKEFRLNNPDSTKVIFHTNLHTENIRYKIRWSKFNIYAKFKGYYSLRFTRNVKRQLSALIKGGKQYEVL